MMKLVVLSCLVAASSASVLAGYAAPLAWSAPLLAPYAPLAYSASLLTPSNYRGPLSLAPGQPADIIASDGRPLDTLDVNLDRSAHFTAKALEGSGIHLLKKRSAILTPSIGGIAYGAPWIGAPLAYSYRAPLLAPSNYRGPLSLAPGQPANIIAADGRPLDTLEVNLDRSAHYTRKALENSGIHLLKKRSAILTPSIGGIAYSAPWIGAPLAYSYRAPLLAPSNYRGPLSLAPGQPANIIAADGRPLDTLDVNLDRAAHYTEKALVNSGIHLLKKRSAVFATPVSRVAYGAPLIAAPLGYSSPIVSAAHISPYSAISYGAPIAHTLYK